MRREPTSGKDIIENAERARVHGGFGLSPEARIVNKDLSEASLRGKGRIVTAEIPSGFRKDDSGKLRYDLIPPEALEEYAKVLTFGASKYGDRDWEKFGPDFESRMVAALMRHLERHRAGEGFDEDGQLHMAAVMFCAGAILTQYRRAGFEKMCLGDRNIVDTPSTKSLSPKDIMAHQDLEISRALGDSMRRHPVPPTSWLRVLVSEVGEVADETSPTAAPGNIDRLKQELAQVTAVCLRWLEDLR